MLKTCASNVPKEISEPKRDNEDEAGKNSILMMSELVWATRQFHQEDKVKKNHLYSMLTDG
jgi:hypothetical protein